MRLRARITKCHTKTLSVEASLVCIGCRHDCSDPDLGNAPEVDQRKGRQITDAMNSRSEYSEPLVADYQLFEFPEQTTTESLYLSTAGIARLPMPA